MKKPITLLRSYTSRSPSKNRVLSQAEGKMGGDARVILVVLESSPTLLSDICCRALQYRASSDTLGHLVQFQTRSLAMSEMRQDLTVLWCIGWALRCSWLRILSRGVHRLKRGRWGRMVDGAGCRAIQIVSSIFRQCIIVPDGTLGGEFCHRVLRLSR